MRLHEFIHLSRAETASTAEGVYLVMSGVQTVGLTPPLAGVAADDPCPATPADEGVDEPQAFNSLERLLYPLLWSLQSTEAEAAAAAAEAGSLEAAVPPPPPPVLPPLLVVEDDLYTDELSLLCGL